MTAAPPGEYLAIADISGYTSYLRGVELDHAQDILSDLTVTVVEAMAPFALAKLEGDAAFVTAPTDAFFDGSALQDAIEGTYIAFKRRLRDIQQASSCGCDACIRIPDLDLKIVVHHGTVGRQRLMGLEELVGPEVILVHRLLKNDVRETTGIAAYALYTQAAVTAARIDAEVQGLVEQREETDVAGEVRTWIRDLAAVWAELARQPRFSIPPDRQTFSRTVSMSAPVGLVFDRITSVPARMGWDSMIDLIEEDSTENDGRRGTGTTNHCMHGKDAIVERILDWRPPHFWATSTAMPMPGTPVLVRTESIEPRADGGSDYTVILGTAEGRTPEDDVEAMAMLIGNFERNIPPITEVVERAHRALLEQGERTGELPERGDRHLTEPIEG